MASLITPSLQLQSISKSIVKPLTFPSFNNNNSNQKQFCNLTPWDLDRLAQHYMHVGLIFTDIKPKWHADSIADHLQNSLAFLLSYYYPLAGRLVPEQVFDGDRRSSCISIDCNGNGVEFNCTAARGLSVNQLKSPFADPRKHIHGLFPLNGALNYDGCNLPLFAAQLTELADGLFLGCSFNHSVGDGASFQQLLRSWAEISRSRVAGIDAGLSRPPVFDHWFTKNSKIKLQDFKEEEVILRYPPKMLTQRLFHFTPSAINRLTERANEDCTAPAPISSYLALCALIWKCVTRARRIAGAEKTTFWIGVDNRLRLKPRLHRNFFGNAAESIDCQVLAGELLTKGIGWGALQLYERLANYNNSAIRSSLKNWMAKPVIHPVSPSISDPNCLSTTGSPRFDRHSCDFGWGKATAARSGESARIDGSMVWWPGPEGKGSAELELCLDPSAMSALESDPEFMEFVSHTNSGAP